MSDLYKLNTKSGSPLRSSINDTPFFCRLRPTTLPLLDPWRCFYEASGHFGPLELAEGQQSPDSRRRKLLLVQEVESVTYRLQSFSPIELGKIAVKRSQWKVAGFPDRFKNQTIGET